MELAIPGPPSLPVLGNTLDLVGLTEANVFPTLLALWGDRRRTLSRISILGKLIVFVSDPDHLEAVVKRKDLADKAHLYYDLLHAVARYGLFQINGELWRRHRRALQPAFHTELLDRAIEYFEEEARGFARRVVPDREVDVTDETRRAVSRQASGQESSENRRKIAPNIGVTVGVTLRLPSQEG
ncbi:Cytochrome P450 4e5, mitochondrial [Frankliniella fusca]|uniref:Cytochrome P450 4e5, mitochondrial n=1 Tax=Frankliniella fusca TaxID=407009 RepID=A0AAE1L6S9_9NEOP|nr:Cytochrome P450 4e5, mitochondrial [Frankliniella fusca]